MGFPMKNLKLVPPILFLTTLATMAAERPPSLPPPMIVEVDVEKEMSRLLKQADTDRDKKITVDDLRRGERGGSFWLQDVESRRFEVSGTYYLANLLQELKLALDRKSRTLLSQDIFENPVHRISRFIREIYWDNLVRRVDANHLAKVLEDEKMPKSEWRHLYVPEKDREAFDYFSKVSREKPDLKFKVWSLPTKLDSGSLREISARHGLLALALKKTEKGAFEGVPYVVPGGRFNEMYGWDSYFESLGLINDGRVDLAKAMVDNFVYQIENYGKILNANRSYYLNRSQPPFFTSMIRAVYEKLEKTPDTKIWLARAVRAAVTEYLQVWQSEERVTEVGLNRYFGSAGVIPPEVEKGHFDFILRPAAKRHGVSIGDLQKRYNSGAIKDNELDEFFSHDRAVRESGHDTTYRWRVQGRDRAADFVTVDLNSLLYKFELDLAWLIRAELGGRLAMADRAQSTTSEEWTNRAKKRRELMLRYLWNPERKMFFDYCFKEKKQSTYVSATAFYPFWAEDPQDVSTRFVAEKDAVSSMHNLLKALEQAGGLSASSESSLRSAQDLKHARQWDYPNGWAPHQMIAWTALKNYRRLEARNRLIYRWLYTIVRNAADFNGTVPEKFDVVKSSHAVFDEYGNVGTKFSYITQEGFGWMNASYQVGLAELPGEWHGPLERLMPPEWVSFTVDE